MKKISVFAALFVSSIMSLPACYVESDDDNYEKVLENCSVYPKSKSAIIEATKATDCKQYLVKTINALEYMQEENLSGNTISQCTNVWYKKAIEYDGELTKAEYDNYINLHDTCGTDESNTGTCDAFPLSKETFFDIVKAKDCDAYAENMNVFSYASVWEAMTDDDITLCSTEWKDTGLADGTITADDLGKLMELSQNCLQ